MIRGILNHGLRTKIRTGSIIGSSIRIRPGYNLVDNGRTRAFHQSFISRINESDKTQTKDFENDDKEASDGGIVEESSSSVTHAPISAELSRKIDGDSITNYVDTLHIFNELKKIGFTEGQSDLILQLVNKNLSYHINKMNNKFTTSMEMENESYLFEAAQAEIRIEINSSREQGLHTLENEKNSMDLLLNEESEELNKFMIMSSNDTQVLINDQNNENTLLQRSIKMKIKDLDNKISTNINSDIKTDIESLRWQTTRSGLLAILVLVFSIMGGVSISKRMNREGQPTEVILHTVQQEISADDDDDEEDGDDSSTDQKSLK